MEEEKKENRKFILRLLRIIIMETEGFSSDENRELIREIISFKRLWPVMLILAAMIFILHRFGDALLWLKTLFEVPP